MGTPAENYRIAYNDLIDALSKVEFRSLDEKGNVLHALGRTVSAAYDFGSADAEAKWRPSSIHEVF